MATQWLRDIGDKSSKSQLSYLYYTPIAAAAYYVKETILSQDIRQILCVCELQFLFGESCVVENDEDI